MDTTVPVLVRYGSTTRTAVDPKSRWFTAVLVIGETCTGTITRTTTTCQFTAVQVCLLHRSLYT